VDNVTDIIVFDTETTGLDPATGAEICEVGLVSLKLLDGQWAWGRGAWTYVETNAPFEPEARAAHHIHPYDCRPGMPDCVPRSTLISSMKALEAPGTMLYAAHNAPFDLKFLPELSLAAIDTCQVARHLWPAAPRYANQVLRYYLNAEPPYGYLDGLAPHRALYDAACTAAILIKALDLHPPGELLRLSTTPVLLTTCKFGKYEGKPWAEIPGDYLLWMVRSFDKYQTDADLRFTVDHYLTKGI